MRTNVNLLEELLAYLTAGGFTVYLDKIPKGKTYQDLINENGAMQPYIIINSTPFNLLRSDKRAAGNKYATRTGNVRLLCMADGRLAAAELAQDVDNYLHPDDNEAWHCSDGTGLETYSVWSYDTVDTASEIDIFISTLIYRCQKNISRVAVL
jgi:hypothetical protein